MDAKLPPARNSWEKKGRPPDAPTSYRPPFQAETPIDTLIQVLERDPVQSRRIKPKTDRDLEAICLKCLEKEPGQRYPSARALATDLERWLVGESVRARRAAYGRWLWKWLKRNPLPGAGVIAAALYLSRLGMVFATTHSISQGSLLISLLCMALYMLLIVIPSRRHYGQAVQTLTDRLRERTETLRQAEQVIIAQKQAIEALKAEVDALSRREPEPGRDGRAAATNSSPRQA